VRDNRAAFVDEASEASKGLPRYVVHELDEYLRCGLLEHGFVRLHCDACGEDRLVAFSCKNRGLCPSCGGRRMANTAAHLVDRVFPDVPVRQWVLSLPFALRFLVARYPAALLAASRLFVEEIVALQGRQAREQGEVAGKSGAVTFVQRFGGSLNLHVHFHVVAADGVFAKRGAGVPFVPLRAPPPEALAHLVGRVAERFGRWVRRHGKGGDLDPDASNETRTPSATEACLQVASQRGLFARLDEPTPEELGDDAPLAPAHRGPCHAEHAGFNLHAGVRLTAHDREGRERLFRYGARPPFALERFSELADGRIAYRLKTPNRRGDTHRVMTPVECLARLCALVPPPWQPLVRFHGVFAPHHAWRSLVVPAPVAAPERPARGLRPPQRSLFPRPPSALRASDDTPPSSPAPRPPSPPSSPRPPRETNASRFDWATLLARTFVLDALECPRCFGRLRPIAVVTAPASVAALLDTTRRAPVAQARPPPAVQLRLPLA
jgi:hypothetical protein